MDTPLNPRNQRSRIRQPIEEISFSQDHGLSYLITPTSEGSSQTLFLGGIHGDEPDSVAILGAALRCIPEGKLSAYVMPCLNTSGTLLGLRSNKSGVDLNRNFPAGNWTAKRPVSRWLIGEKRVLPISSGTPGQSEPEITALILLIARLNIKRIVSVHSPLGFVEGEIHDDFSHNVSTALSIPFKPEEKHKPGSLASWCVENRIAITTLELPPMSLNEARAKLSEPLSRLMME